MTLPSSGAISFSNINTELALAATYSSNLYFLNSFILPALAPANPNMSAFYGLTYYQNTNQGNCNNGNTSNCNCNCGNIQCNNCTNCNAINCANCQTQKYLQTGTNCTACTYNCNVNATSYNCNCACNCSKIICAKLYEFGYLDPNVWAADQRYGKWLRQTDRRVYRGYIRWARTVTAWMDGKGPDCFVWLPKEQRAAAQKEAITKMSLRIGIPWSEHMAYLMGARTVDNLRGRVLMTIGVPISRLIDYIPHRKGHRLATLWGMWALFWMSHWTADVIVAANKFMVKTQMRFKQLLSRIA
jgi:hypothetical protein